MAPLQDESGPSREGFAYPVGRASYFGRQRSEACVKRIRGTYLCYILQSVPLTLPSRYIAETCADTLSYYPLPNTRRVHA